MTDITTIESDVEAKAKADQIISDASQQQSSALANIIITKTTNAFNSIVLPYLDPITKDWAINYIKNNGRTPSGSEIESQYIYDNQLVSTSSVLGYSLNGAYIDQSTASAVKQIKLQNNGRIASNDPLFWNAKLYYPIGQPFLQGIAGGNNRNPINTWDKTYGDIVNTHYPQNNVANLIKLTGDPLVDKYLNNYQTGQWMSQNTQIQNETLLNNKKIQAQQILQAQQQSQPTLTAQQQSQPTLTNNIVVKSPLTNPNILLPSQLGDATTQGLIGQGYTVEQALQKQLQNATAQNNLMGERFYSNELSKQLNSNIGLMASYHAAAMASGLPQAPNPYENVADLSLIALKGTDSKDYASLQNVTPATSLNLTNGQGIQDAMWVQAVNKDKGQPITPLPNFTDAINAISAAKTSGNMGAYKNLGNSYSNIQGALSLQEQQSIATLAASHTKDIINTNSMNAFVGSNLSAVNNLYGFNQGNYKPIQIDIPAASMMPIQNKQVEPSSWQKNDATGTYMSLSGVWKQSGGKPETTTINKSVIVPSDFTMWASNANLPFGLSSDLVAFGNTLFGVKTVTNTTTVNKVPDWYLQNNTNQPGTYISLSGGSPDITALGKQIESERASIDPTNFSQVDAFNTQVSKYNEMSKANPLMQTTTTVPMRTPSFDTFTQTSESASNPQSPADIVGQKALSLIGIKPVDQSVFKSLNTYIKNTNPIISYPASALNEIGNFENAVIEHPITNVAIPASAGAVIGAGFALGIGEIGLGAEVLAGSDIASISTIGTYAPAVINAGLTATGLYVIGSGITGIASDKNQISRSKSEVEFTSSLAGFAGGAKAFDIAFPGGAADFNSGVYNTAKWIDTKLPDIKQSTISGTTAQTIIRAGPQLEAYAPLLNTDLNLETDKIVLQDLVKKETSKGGKYEGMARNTAKQLLFEEHKYDPNLDLSPSEYVRLELKQIENEKLIKEPAVSFNLLFEESKPIKPTEVISSISSTDTIKEPAVSFNLLFEDPKLIRSKDILPIVLNTITKQKENSNNISILSYSGNQNNTVDMLNIFNTKQIFKQQPTQKQTSNLSIRLINPLKISQDTTLTKQKSNDLINPLSQSSLNLLTNNKIIMNQQSMISGITDINISSPPSGGGDNIINGYQGIFTSSISPPTPTPTPFPSFNLVTYYPGNTLIKIPPMGGISLCGGGYNKYRSGSKNIISHNPITTAKSVRKINKGMRLTTPNLNDIGKLKHNKKKYKRI